MSRQPETRGGQASPSRTHGRRVHPAEAQTEAALRSGQQIPGADRSRVVRSPLRAAVVSQAMCALRRAPRHSASRCYRRRTARRPTASRDPEDRSRSRAERGRVHRRERQPPQLHPPWTTGASLVRSSGFLASTVHALDRCALDAFETIQRGDQRVQRLVVFERRAIGDVDRRSLT